jgi:hypothetical protein
MNSYKITYIVGEGETEETYITERTEAAARKLFKKASGGREITDVELYDTDAPATKDQERETLEKIKAMVAELGPQSYLATAFEGCFADAESNIENDFGDSMQRRWENSMEELSAAKEEINRLKAEIAAAQKKEETLQGQFDFASQHIKKLERQQLPEQLRRDLWVMVTDEAEASRARMAEAADKMAVGADNPGCVLFKDSVARYRAEKARAEAMEQRAAELDALEPKSE